MKIKLQPLQSLRHIMLLWVALCLSATAGAQTITPTAGIVYVRPTALGTKDGSSWGNATADLQGAINAAGATQVWVTAGTYQPDATSSFKMKSGVAIYGSFPDTDNPVMSDRMLPYPGGAGAGSILKGNGNSVISNSYVNNTALLDGFTITGGNATIGAGIYNSSSSPVLRNLIITANKAAATVGTSAGGGMYNVSSSPKLTNVTINGNSSGDKGGGMYNHQSSPILTNVTISGNTAADGGGMYNYYQSSPTLINVVVSNNTANGTGTSGNGGGMVNQYNTLPKLINVTISGNKANTQGGGMYNDFGAKPAIQNSIIWGNTKGSSTTNNIYNNSSSNASVPIYSYSIIQGSNAGWTNFGTNNGNNLDSNPAFTNAAIGDYSLQSTSPAINKGNNTVYTTNGGNIATDKDLAGNPRVYNGATIDIGAYEYQVPIAASAAGIVYVKQNGGGTKTGASWANAVSQLADALKAAKTNTAIKEIWVAQGTYKPLYRADNLSGLTPTDPNNAFVLVQGVKLYGGFAGTETSIAARSWKDYPTILSGDLDNSGSLTDADAYHVLVGVGYNGVTINQNVVIDGFTVSSGNAIGNDDITVNGISLSRNSGGAISLVMASPSLSNMKFEGNNAYNGGAVSNYSTASPKFEHVRFTGNTATGTGGAIFNAQQSVPRFTSVEFSSNTAGTQGGAIANINSGNPSYLTNVLLANNNGGAQGGAIYNYASSPILTNVTITGNTVTATGGAMYNDGGSSPNLLNSIIWGNTASGDAIGNVVNKNTANDKPVYASSLIQGSGGSNNWDTAFGSDNYNNLDANPRFADAATGDYTLKATSPAINKGSNSVYTTNGGNIATDKDLMGQQRVYNNGTIDMGAYEYQGEPVVSFGPNAHNIIYVKQGATGSGSSWDEATDLATALQWAQTHKNDSPALWDANSPLKIYIAKGMYKPSIDPSTNAAPATGKERNATFLMVNNVQLYGGFAGNEANLDGSTADLIGRTLPGSGSLGTILTGDLDSNDDTDGTINGNNAYHVVLSAGAVGNAVLDGFTITGGKAETNGTLTINSIANINTQNGGGMYNASSSPALSHISITGNQAVNGGGMLNNGSTSTLTNVSISGNIASGAGGGMYNNANAALKLTNVIISNNTAAGVSGGMYNNSSSPILTNVTISNNKAGSNGGGGGMFNLSANVPGSSPIITNSIIWGNTKYGNVTDNIYNDNINGDNRNKPVYSNSLVQGSGGSSAWVAAFGTNNGNNIDKDPQFTDAAIGDYTLKATSPAINKGSNSVYTTNGGNIAADKDLIGQQRVYNNGTIDMGAYEYQGEPDSTLPVTLLSYTAKANGNHAQLQWQTTSESNNKGFVIYRAGQNGEFVQIGEVSATMQYTFTDKTPLNGNNYYKLVQVDNDGKKTDLGIRAVTFRLQPSTFSFYPNPTANIATVAFAPGTYTQLQITDVNGKVLQRIVINPSEGSKVVSLGAYPTGIYMFKLSGNNINDVIKIVKQ
jgi:predicted outer membrane repeat protein